jgi:hypothetical protein
VKGGQQHTSGKQQGNKWEEKRKPMCQHCTATYPFLPTTIMIILRLGLQMVFGEDKRCPSFLLSYLRLYHRLSQSKFNPYGNDNFEINFPNTMFVHLILRPDFCFGPDLPTEPALLLNATRLGRDAKNAFVTGRSY